MTTSTESRIRAALAGLLPAESLEGLTLAPEESGLKATLVVRIEPKKGASTEALQARIEAAVQAVEGVSSVGVIFTAHKAAQPPKPQGPQKLQLSGIRHVVAVASGKGGVGKSTTAVNLAVALAGQGLKVGLLDTDVYGPSIPRMLGLEGQPAVDADDKMVPHERFGLKVMSIGFLVPEDAPVIWRGPMVHGAITQLFRDVAWGELDVLVLDLPPGTGDAQLTLAQSCPLSGAVIVSTPQDIALLDTRKGMALFAKTGVPVLGMIENMSVFCCPNCGHNSDIFGHGGAAAEAERLNLPCLAEIPLTMEVRVQADAGEPVTLACPDSPAAVQYRLVAERLWHILNA